MPEETPEQKEAREAQEAADAAAATAAAEAAKNKEGTGEATFTQADVDRIIAERLKRQEAQLQAEAKTAAERAKLEEGERLRLEKADLETKVAEVTARAEAAEQRAEVILAAVKANVPAERLERFVKLTEVGDAGVEAAVKATITDFPEFVAKPKGTGAEFNGKGDPITKEAFEAMSYAEKVKLHTENPEEFERLSA